MVSVTREKYDLQSVGDNPPKALKAMNVDTCLVTNAGLWRRAYEPGHTY